MTYFSRMVKIENFSVDCDLKQDVLKLLSEQKHRTSATRV